MHTVPGRAMAPALFVAVMVLWGGMGRGTATAGLPWFSPELRRLETQKQALEQTLSTLPAAPVPHPSERVGWHSDYSSSPDTVEWVELTLARPESLDAVVLISPPPGGGTTELGYGFPLRFRVELLSEGDETGRVVIADFTREDFPNPGLLPVVIPAGGRTAHKVRITATRLFQEGNRCLFALGEVMLLQGQRNLGPQLEVIGPDAVHASSSQGTRPDWGRINLVDGYTVLGPPLGGLPSTTLGFRSTPKSESRAMPNPWVALDLGSVMPIDEVRFFPAHPPQFAHSHGYGFPLRYELALREAADAPPFLLSAPQSGSYTAPPGDNVVTIVAGGRAARFIRLNVLEPHVSNGSVVLALAEMQVWSGGRNIAPGKVVLASHSTEVDGWSTAALVDGFTSRANIVDWPEWLAGLSQRREVLHQLAALEMKRGEVVQEWRRAGLISLGFLIAAAAFGTVIWMLHLRRERRLELEALRQRISQDLHDEIGSSLGSIALISQDALSLAPDEALRRELVEIRETAVQTLDSMRDIVRLAQSGVYGQGDLTAHLREIAGRMLRGIPHTLHAGAETAFNQLPVHQRRDLVLMFKETLYNLSRHAQATQAEITLAQSQGELTLSVHDNGRGFDPAAATANGSANGGGMGLTNLQRRAAKHGGNVQITSQPAQGTTICITFPRHYA